MIYGIGTDITEVRRFEKWVLDENLSKRYFNEKELSATGTIKSRREHLAVRFAAKEAFSKALGTGIFGFELKDLYIQKDKDGKPYFVFENTAKEILEKRVGKCVVHVSLSHEKEYATAFVIIEKLD